MEKNAQKHWQSGPGVTIVCALFLSVVVARTGAAQDDGLAGELAKARIALKGAEDRWLDANAELVRTQRELAAARADLSETHLAMTKLRQELAALRMQAANVLASNENLADSQLMLQLQRDLHELNRIHKELYRQLLDYQRAAASVLDVKGKDEDGPLRRLLAGKMALIQRKLDDAERLTRHGGAGTAPAERRKKSQVLAVNQELGVVVLAVGREHGVRPGSVWQIEADAGAKVKARVVEARQSISAAMVFEGRIGDVRPGAAAALAVEPREASKKQ